MQTNHTYNNVTGADAGSLIGGTIGTVVSVIFAKQSQKEAKKLEQQLQALSEQQKMNLENKLLQSKSITEKEATFFKFLTEIQNENIRKATNRRRLYVGIALGVGLLFLGIVAYKINKANKLN